LGKAFLLNVESNDLKEVDLDALEAQAIAENEAEAVPGPSSSSTAHR
jgi:hypothetical protein